MDLYSGGLQITGRIFASEILGAYFREGLFLKGFIIRILQYFLFLSTQSPHKSPDKPLSSFLSASSTSAAWPEQISPLEPSKDSISGGPGGFDALGVRPREQPSSAGDGDGGSQGSSGRSTPVYHHYHHHFHHTQPQGRIPGMIQLFKGASISLNSQNIITLLATTSRK